MLIGLPQGLNGLANQNALYHQADPARIGSSAGLLRTFTYLGAMAASAANAAFFTHGADTDGLHHLSMFMLAVAVLLLVTTLADRSLRKIGAAEKQVERLPEEPSEEPSEEPAGGPEGGRACRPVSGPPPG